MFQVSVEETFSAGHALRGYRGKCENPHGHNYRVRVTLQGPQLDSIGLLCDFTQLKHVMREIIGSLDHQFMNDLEAFCTVNVGGKYGQVLLRPDHAESKRLTARSADHGHHRLGNRYHQRSVSARRLAVGGAIPCVFH